MSANAADLVIAVALLAATALLLLEAAWARRHHEPEHERMSDEWRNRARRAEGDR